MPMINRNVSTALPLHTCGNALRRLNGSLDGAGKMQKKAFIYCGFDLNALGDPQNPPFSFRTEMHETVDPVGQLVLSGN